MINRFTHTCLLQIHEFMSGRIKLTRDGVPIQPDSDLPEIPYEYDVVTAYDQECGTYALEPFQLPNPECPVEFVCDVPEDDPELAAFSNCIDSMNCAMMAGMTASVSASESEEALFLHNMIPHHEVSSVFHSFCSILIAYSV